MDGVWAEVPVPIHCPLPESGREDAALDGAPDDVVVHDRFDAPNMVVGVGGSVVLVQHWRLFHPSREVGSSDTFGQRAAEVLFLTWSRGSVVPVSLGSSLVVVRTGAVIPGMTFRS